MSSKFPSPLGGSAPSEINLSHAPLARVVAQVRFPTVLKIDTKEAVTPFQESIRRDYPILEQEPTQQIQLQVGPGGPPSVRQVQGTLWRFLDGDRHWRLTLSNDSVSLDTDRYVSRKDFLERLTKGLAAVQDAFEPQFALRLGLRYVDRVAGRPFETIDELLRPGVLGVVTPEMRPHVRQSITEATLAVEEGEMLLRWGIMPGHMTVDPGLVPPIPETSWILDIDVTSGDQRPFNSGELESAYRALAERAYAVFRFMTTSRFLKTYGADQ